MKNLFRDLILVGLTAAAMLALGADSSGPAGPHPDNGRYQSCTNRDRGVSETFVLDTRTGQMHRYLFYNLTDKIGNNEGIRVETFGSLENPDYKEVAAIAGGDYPQGY